MSSVAHPPQGTTSMSAWKEKLPPLGTLGPFIALLVSQQGGSEHVSDGKIIGRFLLLGLQQVNHIFVLAHTQIAVA